MGTNLATNQFVCKDGGPCEFAPFPGAGPGKSFGDFANQPAPCTWRVCVGDSNAGDLTVVRAIALGFDKII